MDKRRIGRALAYVGLALGTGMAAVSPANAFDPEYMYDIYYYSDASHTTLVGHDRQDCFYWGIGYSSPTEGQWTQYSEQIAYATCDHGVIGPI